MSDSWARMQSLKAVAVSTLAACGLPGVCRAAIVPGVIAVLDSCGSCAEGECGGQVWVRLVSEFPSSVFPQPDTSAQACDAPLAFQIEVGIARCLPVGTTSQLSGFIPPTQEQQERAAKLQDDDKNALKDAIRQVAEDADVAYVLGTYQSVATQADCGGGVWTVTFWSL
jgi:hypothetical protein